MNYVRRLSHYQNLGIGLERKALRLLPHQNAWKEVFREEAQLIAEALQLQNLQLFHCGSTSIPQISAKPVIDIIGSVPSLLQLDERNSALEELGYENKGEYGIVGRRYSVLYNREKTVSFVHIHFFEEGHPEIATHLLFRDYLLAHPQEAKRYEEAKQSLLSGGTPREAYSPAKNEIIAALLAAARAWKTKS